MKNQKQKKNLSKKIEINSIKYLEISTFSCEMKIISMLNHSIFRAEKTQSISFYLLRGRTIKGPSSVQFTNEDIVKSGGGWRH